MERQRELKEILRWMRGSKIKKEKLTPPNKEMVGREIRKI